MVFVAKGARMCVERGADAAGAVPGLYLGDVPRRPRKLLGDGTYHVTARGVAASEIFRDDFDYRAFLVLYRDVARRFGWRSNAFCLMPNHVHLVISAPRLELSAGMHRLNCLYAMRFNRRYQRPGHLFQNRFDARLVEGDRHLRAVCRYVIDNPVRARLVRRRRDWPWSGLGAL
ncbi:MAG TPA: transposase [Gaiellaceae bacterium]|jgi:REP element-mobilizing transposase RayT